MLTPMQIAHIKKLSPHLTASYVSILKYCETNDFPEKTAIEIDNLTKGEISVAVLCPNTLGVPLFIDEQLVTTMMSLFKSSLSEDSLAIYSSVLNYLEVRQPTLYTEFMDRLSSTDGGEKFFAQRLAHRGSD